MVNMAGGLAIIICSLIFSLIGLVATGFIGFVVLTFVKGLTPYQFDKLKGRKISNTKIQKRMDEFVDKDLNLIVQEAVKLDLFPASTTYSIEKNAAPNWITSIFKKVVAPAIPSLVAGVPAEQVAVGQAAQLGAEFLGSDQAMKTISGVWDFLKMIAQARKNKQIALPKKIGSTDNQDVEMKTI